MAPHLTAAELSQVRVWQNEGKSPLDVHRLLRADRERAGVQPVGLTAVRKMLKGCDAPVSGGRDAWAEAEAECPGRPRH